MKATEPNSPVKEDQVTMKVIPYIILIIIGNRSIIFRLTAICQLATLFPREPCCTDQLSLHNFSCRLCTKGHFILYTQNVYNMPIKVV